MKRRPRPDGNVHARHPRWLTIGWAALLFLEGTLAILSLTPYRGLILAANRSLPPAFWGLASLCGALVVAELARNAWRSRRTGA
jgi:hypothetical protein